MKLEDFLYSVYRMSEKPDYIEIRSEDYKIFSGYFDECDELLYFIKFELRDYANFNVLHTYGFNDSEGKKCLFIIVN